MSDTLQNLNEAKAALHKLMTGRSVVSVWYNGRRTEFSPANKAALEAYIAKLEASVSPQNRRRAFSVGL